MKLSEAIRLGALAYPTIHGPVFKRTWLGNVCGACRAGATALAAGYQPRRVDGRDWAEVDAFIHAQWPWTVRLRGHAPFMFSPANGIALLHEVRHWSAERIAQYIENLEALYTPQPAVSEAA